jgi:hypothetical protein
LKRFSDGCIDGTGPACGPRISRWSTAVLRCMRHRTGGCVRDCRGQAGTAGRPVVLFVLGVNRSGTSALTRVPPLCGGALPAGLVGVNSGSPAGYWEPRVTPDLHRQRHCGPVTEPFGTDWISTVYEALRAAARDQSALDRVFEAYRASEHSNA